MAAVAESPSPTALEDLALAGARRFTAAQYYKMYAAGVFTEGDRVELIDGYILEKPVRNRPHESALRRLTARLPRRLPGGWFLQVQGAVSLPGDSEPEPDGAVLRGDETSYDGRHPGPADIGLIVEVADASRGFDRRVKGRVYAAAGVPAYWIVNVADGRVEAYTDPDPAAAPPDYRVRTDFVKGQDVPVILDGVEVGRIPAADLLP